MRRGTGNAPARWPTTLSCAPSLSVLNRMCGSLEQFSNGSPEFTWTWLADNELHVGLHTFPAAFIPVANQG